MNWIAIIFAMALVTIFVGVADSVRSVPQMLIVGVSVLAGFFFFRSRVTSIPASVPVLKDQSPQDPSLE